MEANLQEGKRDGGLRNLTLRRRDLRRDHDGFWSVERRGVFVSKSACWADGPLG